MARLNVYVPDDLAERARANGLNVSALAQNAIRDALESGQTASWLATIPESRAAVSHAAVLAAVDAARDESGT